MFIDRANKDACLLSNGGLRISGWIGQLSCLTIFSTSLSVAKNRTVTHVYDDVEKVDLYVRLLSSE